MAEEVVATFTNKTKVDSIMKKLLLCVALAVSSCQPAMAVSTEQCSELRAAYLLAGNDKGQDIYDMSKTVFNNFHALSVAGAVSVADEVKRYSNEFMNGSMADRAERAFDKCLQNDPKFNGKYFKGEK